MQAILYETSSSKANVMLKRFTDQHINWAAKLHLLYFSKRPWNSNVFHELLKEKTTIGFAIENTGFILGRVIDMEAEILMLVVEQDSTRQGVGLKLVTSFCDYAFKNHVERVFLEVSVANNPAINLYRKIGFEIVGRRKNYYPEKRKPGNDAFVMTKKSTIQDNS